MPCERSHPRGRTNRQRSNGVWRPGDRPRGTTLTRARDPSRRDDARPPLAERARRQARLRGGADATTTTTPPASGGATKKKKKKGKASSSSATAAASAAAAALSPTVLASGQ